jgi:hypothetical protein
MWPFKKKKNEEEKSPSIVRHGEHKQNLPDLPRIKDKSKGFPSYDHELGEIKKAIDKPIPKYEGGLSNIKESIDKQISAKGETLNLPKRKSSFLKEKTSKIMRPPIPVPIEHHEMENHSNESKPIFIKLNKYNSAKNSLEKIKDLANEAEGLLSDLNHTREEEDRELDKWKSDIEKIKENLLSIDKKLFEL